MKHVALLRGINVGGNKKVDMKELKKCFESLGFENVSTYINSGNVIFEALYPDKKVIEEALEKYFGFQIPIITKSKEQIEKISTAIPSEWENNEMMKTDVIFLSEAVDNPEVLKEIKQNPEVDNLIYTPGAVIWHIDKAHYTKSKMKDFIGTRIYKHMTARNVNTVRKLRELFNP